MGFLTSIFLWSLAGLSVPILIALWNRRRRLQVDFGGFYLLRRIMEVTKRRIQILQWLKLLNRLLLLSLLIGIFAEPYKEQSVLKDASGGFALILDVGRVMQGSHPQGTLIDEQWKKVLEALREMPQNAQGVVLFVSEKCRSLKLESGRMTATGAEWSKYLRPEIFMYTNEATTSGGLQDCMARADSLFDGKSYLRVFISPLPSTLGNISNLGLVRFMPLRRPEVSFIEKPQVQQEIENSQVKISGIDDRDVSMIRPPQERVSLGRLSGNLDLPLTERAWLLFERPQDADPWEGARLLPLEYLDSQEIVLWAAEETPGYLSLLAALRAHPRLKVVRQVGGSPVGDLVIVYGGMNQSLEHIKRVWIFQSPERPSFYPIRDQKQWTSGAGFSDTRRSFQLKVDAGSIFVKRYGLFDPDRFETLESFEDGAPSLMSVLDSTNTIWLTPFDLEDLSTDLSLEPTFIPYLYSKLEAWLQLKDHDLSEGFAKAVWLMPGRVKPDPQILQELKWPGIYEMGADFLTIDPIPYPSEYLDPPAAVTGQDYYVEKVSLRDWLMKLLVGSMAIELILCLLAARFGWLIALLMTVGPGFLLPQMTLASTVTEKVAVGTFEPMNPQRREALKQLIRDSVFLSNLEFQAPQPVQISDLWKNAVVFMSGDQMPSFSSSERQKIREYLESGGLLVFDEPLASVGTAFRQGVERELAQILPGRSLEAIPGDDVIFRTFYLLSEVSGRRLTSPQIEGIKLDKRWVVLFSTNDLLGAILRSSLGDYTLSVAPYGVMQRTLSQRLLMNFLFYSVTIDYKDDAIHLPHILKRRVK